MVNLTTDPNQKSSEKMALKDSRLILWVVMAVSASLLLICYLVFVDCSTSIGKRNCTRVLFIGNSYTSVNDLPAMFVKLARSGAHKVSVSAVAPGGWTLYQHANEQETINLINQSKWNVVVLQEQSLFSADPEYREQYMLPPAEALSNEIQKNQGVPLLFVTWAH